jgi:hypothetical protein
MKNHLQIVCYCLFAVTIYSCHRDYLSVPLKFTAYENNPVLSPGDSGTWDELFVWTPQILMDENRYYLFYTGGNVSGKMAVGVAISKDGFHFDKFAGNPILSPDKVGFDASTVGPGMVLKSDTGWLMYFNAQELVSFSPGRCIGVAAATTLTGPWKKNENPVVHGGSIGEWDAGFIIPSTVLKSESGGYIMFYSGGKDIAQFNHFYIGMAVSTDGISWKKYNDLLTNAHPYAESDPVLTTGDQGEWDAAFVWMANVTKAKDGFRMYYSAAGVPSRKELNSIGFAWSEDGIHWKKYAENPVYRSAMDPFTLRGGTIGVTEDPSLLCLDSICLMYYECGPYTPESSFICVARGYLSQFKR